MKKLSAESRPRATPFGRILPIYPFTARLGRQMAWLLLLNQPADAAPSPIRLFVFHTRPIATQLAGRS